VKLDPRRAQPKLPSWIFNHNPEEYAYEVYEKVVEAMNRGVGIEDMCGEGSGIEPNYPRGYKYEAWKIEDIMEDMREGRAVDLGAGIGIRGFYWMVNLVRGEESW